MNKLNSILLAKYVLNKLGAIDHLKLMKTIYFIEAFHLAYFEESLIEDEFEAWKNGPVSRKVYDAFKNESTLKRKITPKEIEECIECELDSDQLNLIDAIIRNCGNYNSDCLMETSHQHIPWQKAREGLQPEDKSNRIISKRSMLKFYRKLMAKSQNSVLIELYNRFLTTKRENLFNKYEEAWIELAK